MRINAFRLAVIQLFALCVQVAAAQPPVVVPQEVDTTLLPPMNRCVRAFVDAHLGQRVGRGDCWDLAAAALNGAHASWDGQYIFGTPVDPAAEEVLPGDIIQFEGVEVEYRWSGGEYREHMGHHTAVVHAVQGKGRYTLAHQNFGRAGRKVGLTALELDHIVQGTYSIYRPGP